MTRNLVKLSLVLNLPNIEDECCWLQNFLLRSRCEAWPSSPKSIGVGILTKIRSSGKGLLRFLWPFCRTCLLGLVGRIPLSLLPLALFAPFLPWLPLPSCWPEAPWRRMALGWPGVTQPGPWLGRVGPKALELFIAERSQQRKGLWSVADQIVAGVLAHRKSSMQNLPFL